MSDSVLSLSPSVSFEGEHGGADSGEHCEVLPRNPLQLARVRGPGRWVRGSMNVVRRLFMTANSAATLINFNNCKNRILYHKKKQKGLVELSSLYQLTI